MPTIKQKKAFDKVVENGGNVSKAMKEVGYSENTAKTPQKLTDSDGWKELVELNLPDKLIAETHKELLISRRLDHMVFPMGPKEDDQLPELELDKSIKTVVEAEIEMERTQLTDKEIEQLLNDANCVLKKIVHGRTARHVYFWSPDNMARDKALDKAYKLKARYPKDDLPPVQFNFIQVIERINDVLDGRSLTKS